MDLKSLYLNELRKQFKGHYRYNSFYFTLDEIRHIGPLSIEWTLKTERITMQVGTYVQTGLA